MGGGDSRPGASHPATPRLCRRPTLGSARAGDLEPHLAIVLGRVDGRRDQGSIDLGARRTQVDSVIPEQLGTIRAGGMPVHEDGLRIPPHGRGQHLVDRGLPGQSGT